jgi:hypothetical protein
MKKTFEDWLNVAAEHRLETLGWKNAIEGALEALAAERAAKRLAALDALARNDADEIVAGFQGPIETLRGPRSYSHWGMH